MSTRSMIALANQDGTVRAVYCHSDGYPEYNGRLLNEYWTEAVDVSELIDQGDMSSLGATLSTCKFYARGCDEPVEQTRAIEYANYEDLMMNIGDDIEYVYAMLRTGKWAMADIRGGKARALSDVMAELNRSTMYVV